MLLCSSLFLVIYGEIIGAFHSWMQALSSAVKLPALYLITLLICFPRLYPDFSPRLKKEGSKTAKMYVYCKRI
ncbi:hypothetical protein RintRC_1935 [Richelia intracellularis]|nr:hypothetical protein RintRC_1935 [Richelia intracellularis]